MNMIIDWDVLFNSMMTGLFAGIGSTFGAWLVTKNIIGKLDKLEFKHKSNQNNSCIDKVEKS